MSYYASSPQYTWYSRVDTSQAGKCGVVSTSGQQCGGTSGSNGMCYSHEAEVRAEVIKATQSSTNYSYSGGYNCSFVFGYR